MKILILLVCSLLSAHAHSTLSAVVRNGVANFNCIRPLNDQFFTYPMQSWDWFSDGMLSANYSCGFLPHAGREAPTTCEVKAGETIGMGFTNAVEDAYIPIMISNHRGPTAIYMAKHTHGNGGLPEGKAWFKVFQQGLTASIKQGDNPDTTPWACPDNLYLSQGKVNMNKYGSSVTYGAQNFKIPADLPNGDYLIRTELITLQGNTPDSQNRGENRAQLYVGCAQVRVTGGGNGNPTDLVALPGAYPKTHKAFSYVLWRDQFTTAYPYPGPSVYVAGSSPAPTPTPTPVPTPPSPTPTPVPIPPPTPTPTPTPPAPVPTPVPTGPWKGPSELKQDVKLQTGSDFADPTGNYRLLMQFDGNICVYDSKYLPVWCSGSRDRGNGNYYAIVESDGQFKIRDAAQSNKLMWRSKNAGTSAGAPYTLNLMSDRNLVVLDVAGEIAWKAGTSVFVAAPLEDPYNNATSATENPFDEIASSAIYAQTISFFMVLIMIIALF